MISRRNFLLGSAAVAVAQTVPSPEPVHRWLYSDFAPNRDEMIRLLGGGDSVGFISFCETIDYQHSREVELPRRFVTRFRVLMENDFNVRFGRTVRTVPAEYDGGYVEQKWSSAYDGISSAVWSSAYDGISSAVWSSASEDEKRAARTYAERVRWIG